VLRDNAQQFGAAATKLKSNMRCKQYKMTLIVGLVVVAVLAILIVMLIPKSNTTTVVVQTQAPTKKP
jgi:hypothetical protein